MDSAWTDREVHCLIDIWADEEIQTLLESAKRNKPIFERIAKEMSKAGYNKTAEQCREKIKKLKLKYKKIKDAQQTSGALGMQRSHQLQLTQQLNVRTMLLLSRKIMMEKKRQKISR